MKLTIFIFALALIAGGTRAWKPEETCYTKTTKCCYRFKKCDEKTDVKPITYKCDFKKCEPVCRDVCHKVKLVTPKLVCKNKPMPVRICKGRRSHGHGWGGWGSRRRCYTKYIKKHVCKKIYKTHYNSKCKKVCAEGCKTIAAVCRKTKTYKYDVYCPELNCLPTTTAGSAARPGRVTSPNGAVVSTSPSTRKILGGDGDGEGANADDAAGTHSGDGYKDAAAGNVGADKSHSGHTHGGHGKGKGRHGGKY